MAVKLVSLGHDAEFFLGRGGVPVSAGVSGVNVPGTKAEPVPYGEGFVQQDGTAAEVGIMPTLDREEWITRTETIISTVTQLTGCTMINTPLVRWGEELFSMSAEEQMLGCEPDFNAYTGRQNDSPFGGVPFRSAGGHVHFALEGEADLPRFIRCCDLIMSGGMREYEQGEEFSQRRQLYGKLGAYRPKPYGVEYRSLSNAWLYSRELMGRVFDLAVATVEFYNNGGDMTRELYQEMKNG